MNLGQFIQRGGLWVLAQNALTGAVLVLSPLVGGQWHSIAAPIALVVGGGFLAVGGWLGLVGVRALGRNRTSCPEPLGDSILIQQGIYRYVRHPLYSSLVFSTFGWALLWTSWAGLAMAGALTLLLRGKAMREERCLRNRYPEYLEYEQRVKRFVPGLW